MLFLPVGIFVSVSSPIRVITRTIEKQEIICFKEQINILRIYSPRYCESKSSIVVILVDTLIIRSKFSKYSSL